MNSEHSSDFNLTEGAQKKIDLLRIELDQVQERMRESRNQMPKEMEEILNKSWADFEEEPNPYQEWRKEFLASLESQASLIEQITRKLKT